MLIGLALLAAGCGRVTIAVGAWVATCHDVSLLDCDGVARVFVANLAGREPAYLEASGGEVAVVTRPDCVLGGAPWTQRWTCWEASAPVHDGRVCMVIASYVGGSSFAQVGGHDVRGESRAHGPGWPMCR